MSKLQLVGQVAIVTGAASPRGIGWATARRFADEGARVVVLDLDAGAAERAAALLGPDHLGMACDVRDEAVCQAAVGQVLDRLGRIDILVNNAGVSQSQRLLDSTQQDYDLVMDTSVRGSFNMSRAVVPHMKGQHRGAIICIGSVAAQRGGGILGGPHYSAAKGALLSLAKAMARELAPDGVRVNAIAPGIRKPNCWWARSTTPASGAWPRAFRSDAWPARRTSTTRASFSLRTSPPTSRAWCSM